MAVTSGHSIAACSRLAISAELKSGTLSLLNAPAWKVRRTISLIKITDIELSEEAGWFRETLIEQLRITQPG